MGKVMSVGSGGSGAGSDECTLIRANVPKGFTAITADSDDEALEGLLDTETTAADLHVLEGQSYLKFNPQTKLFECRNGGLKNNGTISGSLNCGQSKTIPAGYTTGGTVTANSLASQTPGNAHAGAILAGHSAWVNGSKVAGGIPSYGGQTVAPQTYAQTLSIAGHYNTGNVVVNPFPLPPAQYLKKGVNWYGVVGNWEGYESKWFNIYFDGNVTGFGYYGRYTDGIQNNGSTLVITTNRGQSAVKGMVFDLPADLSGYSHLIVRISSTANTPVVGAATGGITDNWNSVNVKTSSFYNIDSRTKECALDISDLTGRPPVIIGNSDYTQGIITVYRIILKHPS